MSDWLSCYGNKSIKTPHIDALAHAGVRFENAFVPSPVCSTTRSALITGQMQTSLGLHQHRTMIKKDLPESVQTVPEVFRAAGYLTFNEAKDDYNFLRDRSRLYSPKFKRPNFKSHFSGQNLEWLKQLKGKPFFGQIQLRGGKIGGETGNRFPAESRIDEAKVTVPPQYPDDAVFRNAMARHYEQILQTDAQVGLIVKALKEYGLWDSTIVFFFTDHGSPLPRSKQFLYDEGLKVPLIIRIPKQFQTIDEPKVRSDLVSGLDIPVTTIELAGLQTPESYEGLSLFAEDRSDRQYVIAARDRCGIAVDRIRAVRTDKFLYLKNFKPDRALYQPNYRDGYATFQRLRKLNQAGNLTPLQQSYLDPRQRPMEELYNVELDPHQIKNLATDSKYAAELKRHQQILAKWLSDTNDQGARPESRESLKRVFEVAKGKVFASEFDFIQSSKKSKSSRR